MRGFIAGFVLFPVMLLGYVFYDEWRISRSWKGLDR